ncbi:ABC transporter permease [Desnuesiella massiliensis]|uniref:ABC transporter permease n=1 Tax=Desnuesiella massiliensis TaxID=1650662 RepID=UPI0006E34F40|nr:ABC transporter permease [Desnuesiella massiliensis]
MDKIMDLIFSSSFVFSIIRVTTPILYPALGSVIADRAGIPNIGLEGIMLMSALAGVVGSYFSGSALVGLLSAIAAAILMSYFLAYFTLKLKTDVILGGIALNLFSSGATIFILYYLTGDKGTSASLPSKVLPNINIPIIKDIPVIGQIVSGHNVLTYLLIVLAIAVWYMFKHTALGLRLKAVGENPNAAESVGINVNKNRYIALIMSGVLAGLGGAFLSMGYVSWFSRDMTAGRGWIAIAAEAMGLGSVVGTILTSILFGAASALSNVLQLVNMPVELVSIIPYVATVIGLVIYAIRETKKKKEKGIV